MTKIDPFIAVKEVSNSAAWYQNVFGFRRIHGGETLAVMIDENNEVVICLHKWVKDGHPTMMNSEIPSGNGLLLYIKVKNLDLIRKRIEELNIPVEEEMHTNPNSRKREFSLRDPDGYFLTVTEYHEYEG